MLSETNDIAQVGELVAFLRRDEIRPRHFPFSALGRGCGQPPQLATKEEVHDFGARQLH